MALHDEEMQRLNEIERQLAEESPRLAERLAELRPFTISVMAVAGVLASVTMGLVITVVGAQVDSAALVVLGALLTVVMPTVIIWRLWLSRLH
ncbi:MAG: DUF3040 domain-containing protein [Pseudonocardiaceae bacterium]